MGIVSAGQMRDSFAHSDVTLGEASRLLHQVGGDGVLQFDWFSRGRPLLNRLQFRGFQRAVALGLMSIRTQRPIKVGNPRNARRGINKARIRQVHLLKGNLGL